jgi:hypothetical protein
VAGYDGPTGLGTSNATAVTAGEPGPRRLGRVLILPPGHAEAIRVGRRITTREKWILGSVLAAVVAVLVAVAISIGTAEHQTSAGCIDVKFPITIGGEDIYECGGRARTLCASVGGPGGLTSVSGRAIATECRKAGLAVGSPS